MTAIAALLLVLSGISGLYCLVAAVVIWRCFPRRGRDTFPAIGGVSVLIPVRGLEPGAESTWAALCEMDHPDYEVLFGVKDEDDPAAPLLRSLAARYPGRARYIPCPEELGPNHQVSNLAQLLRAARHELIVITDSDMQVTPEYLRVATAPLADPEVGLVTCGYVDPAPGGAGAAVAALGRCVDFLPQVLLATLLDGRMRFALGATLATRRSTIAAVGGLEPISGRIGSDFHLGRLVSDSGRRVVLSWYVLGNPGGTEGLRAVWQRELRWARTIRMNRGPQYYGMFLTFTLPLVAAAAASGAPWRLLLAVGGGAVFARVVQACISCVVVGRAGLLSWLWLLPLRDAMSAAVWLVGISGNAVQWRGRTLRVRTGGVLESSVR